MNIDIYNDSPLRLFLKYLAPSISATLVTSVYILVDTIVIGRGVGADALVALNIILPVFTLFFATGLLFGVGGGVLMSVSNGEGNRVRANVYFSASLLGCAVVTAFLSIFGTIFFDYVAFFLGSKKDMLPLIRDYGMWIVPFGAAFSFSSFLQSFVRNDKDPKMSMIAVLVGSVLNITLDMVFVFVFEMGMAGAAMASSFANIVTVIILLGHFFKKSNTMRFSLNGIDFNTYKSIISCGASNFFVELANGVVLLLFNRSILKFIGSVGIVVFGVISNYIIVGTSLFNGVSQTAQPIIAANYGAGKKDRVAKLFKYGIITSTIISIVIFAISVAIPETLIRAFVEPSNEVVTLGYFAIPIYMSAALFMGANVFIINFLQGVVKPGRAFLLCIMRGFAITSILIVTVPVICGGNSIWFITPATELITLTASLTIIRKLKY